MAAKTGPGGGALAAFDPSHALKARAKEVAKVKIQWRKKMQ